MAKNGIDEAAEKAYVIGKGVLDATFALQQLRASANELAQRAGDLATDTANEERKRELVQGLRDMVAALDEVLA